MQTTALGAGHLTALGRMSDIVGHSYIYPNDGRAWNALRLQTTYLRVAQEGGIIR